MPPKLFIITQDKIMCGIVGYIGQKQALPVLLEGLKRLEYRGYDSAGIAINNSSHVICHKAAGKLKSLENKLSQKTIAGSLGIAHTRWATHGEPNEENAHPHCDCDGNIWMVHNGIIENYQELKDQLITSGHRFRSDTDSEVVAHLLEEFYQGDLAQTLNQVLGLIKGAYGLVVFHTDEPGRLLVARSGSPLVIGLGDQEIIVASDVAAIIQHTDQVIYLDDLELAVIEVGNHQIYHLNSGMIDKKIERVEWQIGDAKKQGHEHYMMKEIYEQPKALVNSIRGRMIMKDGKVKFGGLDNIMNVLRYIERVIIVACGTARHAGMVGGIMLEEYSGLPTSVEYASEFRYGKPVMDERTAVIAISQSGETADTLAAIKEANLKGALTLGIVNVVGSNIARQTKAGVYNHIGPEIAVASTKAYTSQVAILILLSVLFGRQRKMSVTMGKRILNELNELPVKIERILTINKKIQKLAKKYYRVDNLAFLGRKYNYPTAIEGALKLKELSYIHAEGFPSGELKHGSISMIDPEFPSLFIAPVDSVLEKNLSNMEEIKARQGQVIAVTTQGNESVKKIADDVLYIPKTLEMLTPILAQILLQLFAYHMAVLNNRDVDKPRNLAKSVTVE